MRSRTIRVYEFEKLTLEPDNRGQCLSSKELESLVKFNDENDQVYFSPIHKGIKFSHYVGVLQVDGLTLEIIPKADRSTNNSISEQLHWRNALISMLKICKKISPDIVDEANLKKRPMSLMDIYFKMYLDEIAGLLHRGLFKQYKSQEGNIKAWKGRMNFSKNIQHNLVRKDLFYTTHQTYNFDHTLNRILLKAINIISQISTNQELQLESQLLGSLFPEMSDQVISEITFKRIRKSRKLKPFLQALDIAKIIILNYSSDIKSGNTKLLALLFDMNKLWEEYLFRMLLMCKLDAFSVSAQQSQKFWAHKSIRPDLVIQLNGETFVIDAKWKIIDHYNPSDADLKQMYAYNMYWDAHKSMLLYPRASNTLFEESFKDFYKGRESDNLCKLGFIGVLDKKGNLNQEIGYEIIEKLLAT